MSERLNAVTITLYFPDPSLSPNASKRGWYYSKDAKKLAMEHGFAQARQTQVSFARTRLQASITFCPPDNRKRDLDNLFASMKPSMDGMCKGFHCDDSQIRRITLEWGGVDESGDGKVIVKLERMD